MQTLGIAPYPPSFVQWRRFVDPSPRNLGWPWRAGAGVGGHEKPPECLASGPDLISGLPDAILGTIISLLPTDDGARTQALSTRWRHLWSSSPLNLCDGDIRESSRDNDDIIAIVSRVLSMHRCPVRRLSIGWRRLQIRYPDLDSWLRSPALGNLQELELRHGTPTCKRDPPAVFLLASTLRVLALSSGDERLKFPADDVDRLHFTNLKSLTIKRVTIEDSSLHTLLSKCPLLERLVLRENVGLDCLRISSPTLRSFGYSDYPWSSRRDEMVKKVIIENTPLLQWFFIRVQSLYIREDLSVEISGAPKLQFLGSLTRDITTLKLGRRTIFGVRAVILNT